MSGVKRVILNQPHSTCVQHEAVKPDISYFLLICASCGVKGENFGMET